MGERFKAHQNVSGNKPVLPSLELLENGKLSYWIYIHHYCYSESISSIKLPSLFLEKKNEYAAISVRVEYSRHFYKIVEIL